MAEENLPTNPWAFPFNELDQLGQIYQQFPGMTLRDYLAAQALSGSVSIKGFAPSELVYRAFEIADEYLKQR